MVALFPKARRSSGGRQAGIFAIYIFFLIYWAQSPNQDLCVVSVCFGFVPRALPLDTQRGESEPLYTVAVTIIKELGRPLGDLSEQEIG